MKKIKNVLFIFMAIAFYMNACRADIAIIVAQDSDAVGLTLKNIRDLYTGRTILVGDYMVALPLDISSTDTADAVLRDKFYLAVTGMNELHAIGQMTKMMFTGQSSPPQFVSNITKMISDVKNNKTAVGYLPLEMATQLTGIKILFIIKT